MQCGVLPRARERPVSVRALLVLNSRADKCRSRSRPSTGRTAEERRGPGSPGRRGTSHEGVAVRVVDRNSTPAPTIRTQPRSGKLWAVTRQHPLNGAAGWRAMAGSIITSPPFQRATDLGERDALHMRAQSARPQELDVGILNRDIVAHRAFSHERDPRRPHSPNIIGSFPAVEPAEVPPRPPTPGEHSGMS